jgi:hypothetical protein
LRPGKEQQIPSSVRVTIMQRHAPRASPPSHSQTCDSFRAAACAAPTGPGGPLLASGREGGTGPRGFMARRLPQHRPTRVKHGFRHPYLRQRGRVHIANDVAGMRAHEPGGFLMQDVLRLISCLRMRRGRPALVAPLLRQRRRCLLLTIESRPLDLAARGNGARHAARLFGAGVPDAVSVSDSRVQRRVWSDGAMQEVRTGRHLTYDLPLRLVFGTKCRPGVLLWTCHRGTCRALCRGRSRLRRRTESMQRRRRSRPSVGDQSAASCDLDAHQQSQGRCRLLRAHRPQMSGRYEHGVLCAPSCFAGWCAGAPLSTIAAAIRNQKEAAPPPRPPRTGYPARELR